MTKKVIRTKSIVRKELRKVENQLKRPEKAEEVVMPYPVELIQKRTLLRHELKQFSRKGVTGEQGARIKKHWKRQAEEAQKKINIQKRRMLNQPKKQNRQPKGT